MNNLQLTVKGAEIRAVLEQLSTTLAEADTSNTRLVESKDLSPEKSFVSGWDMGAHYMAMRALQRALIDALTGLPKS